MCHTALVLFRTGELALGLQLMQRQGQEVSECHDTQGQVYCTGGCRARWHIDMQRGVVRDEQYLVGLLGTAE